MTDIAIRVENLSKLYRICAKQERYKILRDTVGCAQEVPFETEKKDTGTDIVEMCYICK